ncbi:MAG: hypothetical protein LBH93_00490 [Chitinispirillales bacterium]|jgi:GMP synthase (glutamine-hydrolysing)|nr:hypothetical protein [Chitinispirillales bacterium]
MDKFVTRDFDREHFDPDAFIDQACEKIRKDCAGRKAFNLVSGGVDSTVVFALLNRALGADKVLGLHVDTGLMRQNESEAILEYLNADGFANLLIEDAEADFLAALDGVYDPEEKRQTIGSLYLGIKDKVSRRLKLSSGDWILAQGTIYPDVLETAAKGEDGGNRIKTHHNRVDAILELVKKGLIVEPVASLYKDEVRKVGERLGLPHDVVWRHPFPGPGLGVRILCSDGSAIGDIPDADAARLAAIAAKANYMAEVLPLRCTGNREGERTYTRPALIRGDFDWDKIEMLASDIITTVPSIDRVVYGLHVDKSLSYKLIKAHVTKERLKKLRAVDAMATDAIRASGEYDTVWQMPVILLPLVNEENGGECAVLRPVHSKDALDARVVRLKTKTIEAIVRKKSAITGVGDIFLDVTPKPPATIEWE